MSHKLTQNTEALRDKKKSFTVKIMPDKVKEDEQSTHYPSDLP